MKFNNDNRGWTYKVDCTNILKQIAQWMIKIQKKSQWNWENVFVNETNFAPRETISRAKFLTCLFNMGTKNNHAW